MIWSSMWRSKNGLRKCNIIWGIDLFMLVWIVFMRELIKGGGYFVCYVFGVENNFFDLFNLLEYFIIDGWVVDILYIVI